MSKTRLLLPGCLLGLLSACSSTPEIKTSFEQGNYDYFREYMQQFVQDEVKKGKVTGLSIALVDGQEIVWTQGFGYADKENKISAQPDTRYRAGSITKLFTAISAMQQQEHGKMNIHDPLTTYLPELKIQSRFGSIESITPANIMSHHSGLPSDYVDGMWSAHPASNQSLVQKLDTEFTALPPNQLMVYSNLGYSLLGLAVAQSAGQKYSDVVQNQILTPLQMHDSDVSSGLSGKDAAKGYTLGKETQELPLRDLAAGALNTTVVDMSQFVKMIHRQGGQIISQASLKKMMRPQNLGVKLDLDSKVGLGWHYYQGILDPEIQVVGHDGGTMAHNSNLVIAPELKLGLIILSNDPGNGEAIQNITEKALQLAYRTKTGRHVSPADNQQKVEPVNSEQDLSGTYMTKAGLAFIEKSGDNFDIEALGTTFELQQQESGHFRLSKHILGFIPLSLGTLGKIDLRTEKVDQHQIIVGRYKGQEMMMASKLEAKPIPSAWQARTGEYELLNQLEPEMFRVKKLQLEQINGFLVASTTIGKEIQSVALTTVDDRNAVIAGLGRSLGGNIRVTKENGVEIINYSGLRFRRIN